ncbi:MAG: hypothetical protein V7K98_20630 [Nostoc sp.]
MSVKHILNAIASIFGIIFQERSPNLVGCVSASVTHPTKLRIVISPFFGQPIRERLFPATAIAP